MNLSLTNINLSLSQGSQSLIYDEVCNINYNKNLAFGKVMDYCYLGLIAAVLLILFYMFGDRVIKNEQGLRITHIMLLSVNLLSYVGIIVFIIAGSLK